MSTCKASLATGIPLVNLDKGAPIPGRFVVQLAHELPPADIMNRFRQRRMLDHRLYPQVLDAHRLVLTHDAGRELMGEITATVGHACMDASHVATRLGAVLGTELLLGETPLRFRQLLLVDPKAAGIADLLTTVHDHHVL